MPGKKKKVCLRYSAGRGQECINGTVGQHDKSSNATVNGIKSALAAQSRVNRLYNQPFDKENQISVPERSVSCQVKRKEALFVIRTPNDAAAAAANAAGKTYVKGTPNTATSTVKKNNKLKER